MVKTKEEHIYLENYDIFPCTNPPVITVVIGPLVQEITQIFTPNISQTMRLYFANGYAYIGKIIEIAHTVAVAVPNRDIVTRYSTQLQTSHQFFTDDSGLYMMQRSFNESNVVCGNYYPSVSSSYIVDNNYTTQLAFVASQPHGVTSPNGDGTLEIMLHRRTSTQDFPPLGLNQALNDTTTLNDTLWLLFGEFQEVNNIRHKLIYLINNPPLILYGTSNNSSTWIKKFKTSFVPFKGELPPQVHLTTFKAWNGTANPLLVRFNHIYQSDDNSNNSIPITLNLNTLLNPYTPAATEWSLTYLHEIGEVSTNSVLLNPMDFKSYFIVLSEN